MIPLSFAQRRLWFIDRFEGPSATYNIPFVLHLTGELDVAALAAAVRDVVARHESLRTLIVEDDNGVPSQRVLPMADVVLDVPLVEVTSGGLDAAVAEAASQVIDLATDIPVRATLLRRAPDEHQLILLIHHIASDGESMAPLARDLTEAYTARLSATAPGWADLPVQYVDYTLWQREVLGDESERDSALATQVRYWREELAGLPQPIRLPTDRPRPPVASHRGDLVEFPIEPDLLTRIGQLAKEHGISVPMVLQGALAVALQHLGAGADIAIGSTIAGRTDDDLVDLVGFFVNTWVLRVELSGNPSFEQVLGQVQQKALTAYDNQDAPFEHLVEVLNPERSTAYHPLFQVMFTWENDAWIDLDLPNLRARFGVLATPTAKFDLEFNYFSDPTRPGLLCYLEYATDLFDRATAQSVVDRYVRIIGQLVAEPARPVTRIDSLDPAEWDVFRSFNDTGVVVEGGSVVELVAARVGLVPDAVAVVCGDVSLTYAELDARVGVLARVLVGCGVGPEMVVGLCLPRSVDLVVGLLAVWRAGGAFLPVDPRYPSSRLGLIVSDAVPGLVLTDSGSCSVVADVGVPVVLVDEVGGGVSSGVVLPRVVSGGAAYVMYTSGSTGVPKGVVVTHDVVLNGVLRLAELVGISGGSRVLAASSVNFDVCVFEVVASLVVGATVEVVRDVLVVGERGGWSGSVISAVPSVFGEVLDEVSASIRQRVLIPRSPFRLTVLSLVVGVGCAACRCGRAGSPGAGYVLLLVGPGVRVRWVGVSG